MPLTADGAILTPRILLIGYGNPGRGDDGLGPALATAIEGLSLAGVTVEIDYQLTVDHAALIAAHDAVVFADAMMGLADPFRLTEIGTAQPDALGSHQVTPEAAMELAKLLFGHRPPAWMLAIAGDQFGEVKEGLSPRAQHNLSQTLAFAQRWLADLSVARGKPSSGALLYLAP
jgi:hydrogenase maturation protease